MFCAQINLYSPLDTFFKTYKTRREQVIFWPTCNVWFSRPSSCSAPWVSSSLRRTSTAFSRSLADSFSLATHLDILRGVMLHTGLQELTTESSDQWQHIVKVKHSYYMVCYPVCRTTQSFIPGSLVPSNVNSISVESIQPCCNSCTQTINSHVYHYL